MLKEFRIGLAAEDDGAAGWIRILQQEVLPYDEVDGPSRQIILFSGSLPSWCSDFVAGGGIAVISGAPKADELLGPSTLAVVHRFRTPERERSCEMPGLARLFRGVGAGEVRLHENRKFRNGNLADVYPAVVVRRHRAGWLIASGLPLAAQLAAAGDCLRRIGEISELTERVAATDKADIAETLLWMLIKAFECSAIPYVRLARYPDGAPSVFLFRVDVDGLFGPRCKDLAVVATEHAIRGSFYFNAALCRSYPGELALEWLKGHEIGHHGDVHDLFDTVEDNRRNLAAGMDWVEGRLGVRPTSFVAPRGLWNSALGIALRELGHLYSSDFGLDYDSLPFMTPEGILQIPVHPFSPERYTIFREDSGLGPPTVEGVLAGYKTAFHDQLRLRRPVHLYGHPEVLGRMAREVLPDIFQTRARLGLPNMTLAAFAAWWLARSRTEFALLVDDETGRLHAEAGGAPVLEAWSRCDASISIGLGHEYRLGAGQWTTVTSQSRAG